MDSWGAATLLLPGDPVSVGQFAGRLLDLAGGFCDAAQRVALIEANTWTGSAASAFTSVKDVHVGDFVTAAEAFGRAGVACTVYARVLAAAQTYAGQAVHLHADAEEATARWQAARTACRSQVKEAAQTHHREVGPVSRAVLHTPDPGEVGRARAEAIVASAREQVARAAARAARDVDAATATAPTKPSIGRWLASWTIQPGGLDGQLAAGEWAAVRDLATSLWDTSPVKIGWDLTHGWRPDWHHALQVGQTWSGPPSDATSRARRDAAGQLVDAHDWPTNPARAAGYTLTNLTLLLAGDGLGDTTEATDALSATKVSETGEGATSELSNTSAARDFEAPSTWGSPQTLLDHFQRHGSDFGARTPHEYAAWAANFRLRALAERLPCKVQGNTVRFYDPATNEFGAFNMRDGTTRTYFKPEDGLSYWLAQPGVDM